MKKENYSKAMVSFSALKDYRDSQAKMLECQTILNEQSYQSALTAMNAENYPKAITLFELLKDFRDSAEKLAEYQNLLSEQRYQKADALRKQRKYDEAYVIYQMIPGYNDVDDLLRNDRHLVAAAREAQFQIGCYVTLGTYPQTAEGDDQTPIEWLVLARDGGNALLISRYALDCQPYNGEYVNISWAKCSLRRWLNGDFYKKAFRSADRNYILQTRVVPDSVPEDGSADSTTTDRLFLLSATEAGLYFQNDAARMCAPTDYALSRHTFTNANIQTDGRPACWWWLRTPGYSSINTVTVDNLGSFDLLGNAVFMRSRGVRPCMWVKVS